MSTTHAEDRWQGFEGPDPTRRQILNWFLGAGCGALLVSILYPVSRYLIPPRVEESTARAVTLSIKPEDVKPNSRQMFNFGSRSDGSLVRTLPGRETRV